jgi:signal transduction histidine kinase
MNEPIAAAIAFAALGALFAGTVALLLFNPGSRSVRWWSAFQAANMVWLGGQGWAYANQGWRGASVPIVGGTVHLMAALFLGYALVEGRRWPSRRALLVVLLGVATLPLAVTDVAPGVSRWLEPAWHLALWGTGTVILVRMPWGMRGLPDADNRLGRTIRWLSALVAPIVLVGIIVYGGRVFVYAMPLLVVWIQTLLFLGVARLRFYDIEVRARRTGELAAETGERERLAVVGELSASLAHEIRNPLTGVRSLAQRLAEEEIDDARRQRYAGVILQEVERVERLVANLLGVARRAPRAAAGGGPVALEDLFGDLQLLFGSRAEKAGVRLVATSHGQSLSAPREILTQVVLNLLLNAVAHSPRGGVVELAAVATDGETVIRVRDQGRGVAREERERIWEPFYSGAGGTGLGLAVVRRLCREAGWVVEVDDAPGGGAEFRVRVPTASAAELPVPMGVAS